MSCDARLEDAPTHAPLTLLTAAEKGDATAVLSLLQSGDEVVNGATTTGTTALMKASHCGHSSVVALLQSFGV